MPTTYMPGEIDASTPPAVAAAAFYRYCLMHGVRVWVLYAHSEEHPEVEVSGYVQIVYVDHVVVRMPNDDHCNLYYDSVIETVEDS